MTATYRTRRKLTYPVSDLDAARHFLRCEEMGMEVHIYPADTKVGVHSVTWDLINDHEWEVTVIADHPLPIEQLKALSEWISGQNSDGLGEGFEQQPFAEHEDEEDEDEVVYHMSSFDWETNPCTLERVTP